VLDALGGGDDRRIAECALVLLTEMLLAFLQQPLHPLALLPASLHAEKSEDLLQTLDVAFRLPEVLFERFTQIVCRRRPDDLRQRTQNLLLRAVQILQLRRQQCRKSILHDPSLGEPKGWSAAGLRACSRSACALWKPRGPS
jgi:hypothetical protein